MSKRDKMTYQVVSIRDIDLSYTIAIIYETTKKHIDFLVLYRDDIRFERIYRDSIEYYSRIDRDMVDAKLIYDTHAIRSHAINIKRIARDNSDNKMAQIFAIAIEEYIKENYG